MRSAVLAPSGHPCTRTGARTRSVAGGVAETDLMSEECQGPGVAEPLALLLHLAAMLGNLVPLGSFRWTRRSFRSWFRSRTCRGFYRLHEGPIDSFSSPD